MSWVWAFWDINCLLVLDKGGWSCTGDTDLLCIHLLSFHIGSVALVYTGGENGNKARSVYRAFVYRCFSTTHLWLYPSSSLVMPPFPSFLPKPRLLAILPHLPNTPPPP